MTDIHGRNIRGMTHIHRRHDLLHVHFILHMSIPVVCLITFHMYAFHLVNKLRNGRGGGGGGGGGGVFYSQLKLLRRRPRKTRAP